MEDKYLIEQRKASEHYKQLLLLNLWIRRIEEMKKGVKAKKRKLKYRII